MKRRREIVDAVVGAVGSAGLLALVGFGHDAVVLLIGAAGGAAAGLIGVPSAVFVWSLVAADFRNLRDRVSALEETHGSESIAGGDAVPDFAQELATAHHLMGHLYEYDDPPLQVDSWIEVVRLKLVRWKPWLGSEFAPDPIPHEAPPKPTVEQFREVLEALRAPATTSFPTLGAPDELLLRLSEHVTRLEDILRRESGTRPAPNAPVQSG